ncbi:hypothetical protein E0765_06145 [Sulfuricurvum sp. IAE1]|uniref:AAA family ATPase n=1 Tax=Sulfuricurvum sp. IAE1 TaxID=2546102 RepID=UPI0010474883|nr:AAA family ATPase [Sulfuricurvum sp. IAE1]TDA64293.1 hypothetical protein E0765_06145 [Sulfuricurvum sp. IAE1]
MNEEFYNLAFERSVLASFIFEPAMFARSGVTSDDFYMHAHQNILNAMKDLNDQDRPIDEEFIRVWLSDRKQFDERAMMEVLTSNPISNLHEYIKSLKEYAQRRALWKLGIDLQKQEFTRPSDGIDMIETTLSNIRDMRVGVAIRTIPSGDVVEREPEFVLSNWLPLPRGVVSMISAEGGSGKGWTALQIANRYIDEHPYDKVCLWLSEDDIGINTNRHRLVSSSVMNKLYSDYKNSVHFPVVQKNGVIIGERPKPLIVNGKFDHHAFYRMRQSLRGFGLIVLDPLRSFYGGDENSNTEANLFMGPLQDWAAEENIVLVLLHHSNKDKDGSFKSKSRGASAFRDAVRVMYEIDKIYKNPHTAEIDLDNAHMRRFKMTKDNLGAMRVLGRYEVTHHITPKDSARATVIQYESKTSDENEYKFDFPAGVTAE